MKKFLILTLIFLFIKPAGFSAGTTPEKEMTPDHKKNEACSKYSKENCMEEKEKGKSIYKSPKKTILKKSSQK